MCGIAGFVGRGDKRTLELMTNSLFHRGPDGRGYVIDVDRSVFLGHQRLSIVDLATGAQPIWNEDQTIAVIFNGEIYNHQELRADLISRGHIFRTISSDTEALVHGYEEWGDALAERLNGMFAFALYDSRRGKLLLARDRFGEKPLYYATGNGVFAFASELQTLLLHPEINPTVDPRAIQKYFAHGYFPANWSLYRGTSKLQAGSTLTYDLATGTHSTSRYWKFALEPDEALGDAAEERLADELRQLLIRSVDRRLMSDVPLGIFLSGGIDSASLLAAAAQVRDPNSIDTFTIGFEEPTFDESAAARVVSAAIGSRHHEKRLSLSEAPHLIDHVLSRLGEPLGDPSILPTFLLCRFARESVTVALSGDGGDELFAGYDPFSALGPAGAYSRLVPSNLHRLIRAGVYRLPMSTRRMSLDFKLRRTLDGLSYPRSLWNPVWLSPLAPADFAVVFDDPMSQEELYSEALDCWHQGKAPDHVDKSLEFYTNFYLQDGILAKVDRAGMMVSLESRAPFLDNDLVNFCRKLPHRFKLRNGQRKYLLRKAIAPLVPRSVLHRRKQGFGIPVASWLKTIPMPETVAIPGLKPGVVERCWEEHRTGQADHRLFLWNWLSLRHTLAAARSAAQIPDAA